MHPSVGMVEAQWMECLSLTVRGRPSGVVAAGTTAKVLKGPADDRQGELDFEAGVV